MRTGFLNNNVKIDLLEEPRISTSLPSLLTLALISGFWSLWHYHYFAHHLLGLNEIRMRNIKTKVCWVIILGWAWLSQSNEKMDCSLGPISLLAGCHLHLIFVQFKLMLKLSWHNKYIWWLNPPGFDFKLLQRFLLKIKMIFFQNFLFLKQVKNFARIWLI